MWAIDRATAEAIVDGMTFKVEHVFGRPGVADNPEIIAYITTIQDQMNALFKAKREGLINALMMKSSDKNRLVAHDRVLYKHDCPNPDACSYTAGGSIWYPNQIFMQKANSADPWTVAKHMGLTADPQPDQDRPYVLVAWDNRPGVLQVHGYDELTKP